MKKTLLTLALLVACAAPAAAQEFAPSHLAAASDLLEAARMQDVMETSMEAMLQMQMENQPELRELEPVMRAFFERHVSWSATRGEYARLYAMHFSEAELRDLAAFYRTPLGRKLADVTPALTIEGGRLGQRLVEQNMGELQRMILEHMTRTGND